MSEKRFVCIDVDYGDDWYITDNGKRLSEIEIVDLLNEQQAEIDDLKEENGRLQKNVENLQELVAELGATLLMNGFEIEIDGQDLNELIKNE